MTLRLISGLIALALFTSCGDKDKPSSTSSPPKPGEKLSDDLTWVRETVPGGALTYSADKTIYVVELADGKAKKIGNGLMPEFSPDGSKIAWADRDQLSVANRDGSDARQLHSSMHKHGGAHWLDNEHIAAILAGPKGNRWYRFGLDGRREPMPELDQFGIGTGKNETRETDIRQGADGIWTHVAYRTWKTSDGKSGPLDGGCACSISPDAKSITALQGSHTALKIQPVREGGISHDLKWLYKGRFDNQRWSSNDERFLVGVREKPARMIVIDWRTGRSAAFGRDDHKDKTRMYGDLTKADGKAGKAMPPLVPADQREAKAAVAKVDRGEPVVLDQWPYRTHGMVYLFESRQAANEFRQFTNDPPTKSSGQLRDGATYDRFGRLNLSGGVYAIDHEIGTRWLERVKASNEFSVEFKIESKTQKHRGGIIDFGPIDLSLHAGQLEILNKANAQRHEIGEIPSAVSTHVVVSFADGELTVYRNGSPIGSTAIAIDFTMWLNAIIGFGEGPFDGTLEGVALFDRPIDAAEAKKRYELFAPRLAGRTHAPRAVVDAKLVHYTPPIPLKETEGYRRLVCEHVFEVQNVIEGDLEPEGKIRVQAWSILDMKTLPEPWKGKEGETFRLTLEREEDHPHIEKLERLEPYEGDDALELDGFFLIGAS